MGCCGDRYKGFKGKLQKAKDISEGYRNVVKRRELSYTRERIRTCKNCEFKVELCGSLWCGACYCWIRAKARVEDNICCENKWKR